MITAREANRLVEESKVFAQRKRIASKLEFIENEIKRACKDQDRYIDIEIETDIIGAITEVLVNNEFQVTVINKGISIGW